MSQTRFIFAAAAICAIALALPATSRAQSGESTAVRDWEARLPTRSRKSNGRQRDA